MNTVTKTQAMDKLQEIESALASIAFYMDQQAQPEPTETEEESNASWAAVDAPIPPAVVHHAADEGALK